MRILQRISTLLSISGCSRPSSWTSPRKKLLYKIYTAVAFLFIHTMLVSQILDLALNVDNQDDFSDNLCMGLAIMLSCCKMWTLLAGRGYYENLIGNLQEEPLLPVNADEIEIQMRFDKLAEWNATVYAIFVEFFLGWMFGTSFLADFQSKRLKLRGWVPYNYSSPVSFIVTYAHQVASVSLCALQTIACDSLFGGLLIHIYSQFEMLGHRLENITKDEKNSGDSGATSVKEMRLLPRDEDNLLQCLTEFYGFRSPKGLEYLLRTREDLKLLDESILLKVLLEDPNHFRFATIVNRIFKMLMFIQFLISTMVLCFDLYRFTQQNLGSRFMETLLYALCTFIQIFYYCWCGNEVQLKSREIPDAIFRSNWTSLNDSTKRILLMIMRRATVPIQFTSMYIMSMNLDSFKAILKTSYSAFNVLHQGRR